MLKFTETSERLQHPPSATVLPKCPVFGVCGGCQYQNISYEQELAVKERLLRDLFREQNLDVSEKSWTPIVPSPKTYHYRNRVDLRLRKNKDKEVFIGFTPGGQRRGVVPVSSCPIAEEAISDFIPRLKQEAVAQLPAKYRMANLTVRTGADGRVRWGGIGRRSCRMAADDYFWTEIRGRKVYYSLDTFFQANTAILPRVFDAIEAFDIWKKDMAFYDLYGGVGLFGIGLSGKAARVVLIEENPASAGIALHNAAVNGLKNFEVMDGKVEDQLPVNLQRAEGHHAAAMIDPPRAGLSEDSLRTLAAQTAFTHLIYLSCNPETLVRDLKGFAGQGWKIAKVAPFDFFPRTKHLETLVLLERK